MFLIVVLNQVITRPYFSLYNTKIFAKRSVHNNNILYYIYFTLFISVVIMRNDLNTYLVSVTSLILSQC